MLDVSGNTPLTLSISINMLASPEAPLTSVQQSIKALLSAWGPLRSERVEVGVSSQNSFREGRNYGTSLRKATTSRKSIQIQSNRACISLFRAKQGRHSSKSCDRKPAMNSWKGLVNNSGGMSNGGETRLVRKKWSDARVSANPTVLLDLPFEIRSKIFEMALSDGFFRDKEHCTLSKRSRDSLLSWGGCHSQDYDSRAKALAVLDNANAIRIVCKKIHAETIKMTTSQPILCFCSQTCLLSFNARFPRRRATPN